MKKAVFAAIMIIFMLVSVGLVMADGKGKTELKVGDEIYACDCGEKCPCDSLSRNPGKCTCGKDLVKAKALKVEENKAELKAESWDKSRMFNTKGKYMCNCGPTCKCDTISQNPGKCTCGVDMVEVK